MSRGVFWAPRVLCILFIAFVSMFALDVFEEGLGFWKMLVALAMHLVPSFVMIAALAIAWRREWFGALVFGAAGIFFAFIVRGPLWVKGIFTVPCWITAGLFYLNWLKRRSGATA